MQERDIVTPCAGAWLVVDAVDAVIAGRLQCGTDVYRLDCEVMNAGPVVVEIARNRALVSWLQQFEIAVVEFEKSDHNPVEPFAVDDGRVEDGSEQVCEPIGVIGGDAGVMEAHTETTTERLEKTADS